MCIFRILHTRNRANVAAKCRASRAVGLTARCLCEGGSLKGASAVSSCVFGFLALRITIEEYPSGVLDYKHHFN